MTQSQVSPTAFPTMLNMDNMRYSVMVLRAEPNGLSAAAPVRLRRMCSYMLMKTLIIIKICWKLRVYHHVDAEICINV